VRRSEARRQDERIGTGDTQIGLRSAYAQQFRTRLVIWIDDAQAMDARLQRRIQRYGWDLAADDYEPLWQAQLAEAQDKLFEEITTCFQAYVMLI